MFVYVFGGPKMVNFLYGAPKTCQLFKVLVVLPPLEKFLRAPMSLGRGNVNQLPVSLEFQNDDVICSRTKYTKIFSCAFDGSIKNWKLVTKKLLKRVSIFSHKIKTIFRTTNAKYEDFSTFYFRPKLSIFCARWQKKNYFCEFLTFCSQMRAPKTRSYNLWNFWENVTSPFQIPGGGGTLSFPYDEAHATPSLS